MRRCACFPATASLFVLSTLALQTTKVQRRELLRDCTLLHCPVKRQSRSALTKLRQSRPTAALIASAVLLAGFALTQSSCKSPGASQHREFTLEKGRPQQQGTGKPVASAVASEDALRGAFTPALSVQELDSAVRKELSSRLEEPMAAIGEPYQSTDVVLEHLPWRRFVVAGVSTLSPKVWLLCYEHGGIGYHHHLVLFELENGVALVKKSGQWLPGRGEPVTIERAVQALRNDEQQLDNHW